MTKHGFNLFSLCEYDQCKFYWNYCQVCLVFFQKNSHSLGGKSIEKDKIIPALSHMAKETQWNPLTYFVCSLHVLSPVAQLWGKPNTQVCSPSAHIRANICNQDSRCLQKSVWCHTRTKKKSMTLSTLISWICHHVKRMEMDLRCTIIICTRDFAHFSVKSYWTSGALLIVHSEVVPTVEVPLCDIDETWGRDECESNVVAFVFLDPSPFLSE